MESVNFWQTTRVGGYAGFVPREVSLPLGRPEWLCESHLGTFHLALSNKGFIFRTLIRLPISGEFHNARPVNRSEIDSARDAPTKETEKETVEISLRPKETAKDKEKTK